MGVQYTPSGVYLIKCIALGAATYFEHFSYFSFFFLRLKKEVEKQRLFVQDKIKAIHKTKTTASIIKHFIIYINMYLEKGMNVVFIITRIFFSFCEFLLCIPCIPYTLFRELVSTEVY